MIDDKLLKIKMLETDMSTKAMSKALNITYDTMRAKINGKSDFKVGEAKKIKSLLKLNKKDFDNIFLL